MTKCYLVNSASQVDYQYGKIVKQNYKCPVPETGTTDMFARSKCA